MLLSNKAAFDVKHASFKYSNVRAVIGDVIGVVVNANVGVVMSIVMRTVLAGVFILSAFSASAEIYRCIDANGRPSFSNTPCPDEAVVGKGPAHTLWREMRVLVSEGQSINKLLGADTQSILNCKRRSEKFIKDLEGVSNRLIKLSPVTHKHLFKAMDYIRSCAECRSAAYNDCKKASIELDEQMNVLMDIDRNNASRAKIPR